MEFWNVSADIYFWAPQEFKDVTLTQQLRHKKKPFSIRNYITAESNPVHFWEHGIINTLLVVDVLWLIIQI